MRSTARVLPGGDFKRNGRGYMNNDKQKDQIPEIKFCPYCGSKDIRFNSEVPRCDGCRSVFFVRFSRSLRNPPNSKDPTSGALPVRES